jgi:integrase/recombinase XerD
MIDAMVIRGFSPSTCVFYVGAIYAMAKYYRRDPAEYTAQEVDAYLLHMAQEHHLSCSTMYPGAQRGDW